MLLARMEYSPANHIYGYIYVENTAEQRRNDRRRYPDTVKNASEVSMLEADGRGQGLTMSAKN